MFLTASLEDNIRLRGEDVRRAERAVVDLAATAQRTVAEMRSNRQEEQRCGAELRKLNDAIGKIRGVSTEGSRVRRAREYGGLVSTEGSRVWRAREYGGIRGVSTEGSRVWRAREYGGLASMEGSWVRRDQRREYGGVNSLFYITNAVFLIIIKICQLVNNRHHFKNSVSDKFIRVLGGLKSIELIVADSIEKMLVIVLCERLFAERHRPAEHWRSSPHRCDHSGNYIICAEKIFKDAVQMGKMCSHSQSFNVIGSCSLYNLDLQRKRRVSNTILVS